MSEAPTEVTASPQAESSNGALEPRRSDRVWDVILVFGRFRAVVATLGLIGFAFGIAVAWHADSAVTLLATSAGLILAALLLGPDWERIRAAAGGYEFELQRALVRDQALAQAVMSSESFDEFRQRMERVEHQLAEAEIATRLADPRSRLARTLGGRQAKPSRRPMTGHEFEDGTVLLQLFTPSSSSSVLYTASCVVTDPPGTVTVADGRLGLPALPGMTGYSARYPTDFHGAGALVAGTYEARWRVAPAVPNLFTPPLDIAVHRFTVPDDGEGLEERPPEGG